jgi:DNA mismatch repair protein MutL
VQYCYVNGRMMRDKLLNHAIRQAYAEYSANSFQPSYVLFLQLDPRLVDVNVHPSKHEVRFHESRQVHDFIVQVIGQALQSAYVDLSQTSTCTGIADAAPDYPVSALRPKPSGHHQYTAPTGGYTSPSSAQVRAYNSLLHAEPIVPVPGNINATSLVNQTEWPVLHIFQDRYLLSTHNESLVLADLCYIQHEQYLIQFHGLFVEGLTAQPLLIPQRLTINQSQDWLIEYTEWLQKLGLRINSLKSSQVIVQTVPAILRQTDLATTVPELLGLLESHPAMVSAEEWRLFLSDWLKSSGLIPTYYTMSSAQQLWAWMLSNIDGWQSNPNIIRPIDIKKIIEAFTCD